MLSLEPLRSRVLVGVVLCAAGVVVLVSAHGSRDRWLDAIAFTINSWRDVEPGLERRTSQLFALFNTGLSAVVVMIVVGILVAVANGARLELSPVGISWQAPTLKYAIPWEALAPGGPLRPQSGVEKIELIASHPQLVDRRGWMIGGGNAQRPALFLQFDVHPWFLADAVRWYVEHPEHRHAIGTTAEHDRLTAVLHAQPAGKALSCS